MHINYLALVGQSEIPRFTRKLPPLQDLSWPTSAITSPRRSGYGVTRRTLICVIHGSIMTLLAIEC